MLLRQKPSDPSKYIIVDNKMGRMLQNQGFIPLYMYNNKLYFEKNGKILNAVEQTMIS